MTPTPASVPPAAAAAPATMAVRTENLRKTVRDGAREVTLLRDIDLTVRPGERVAVVGRSGSGKSTLLHILGGLDPDYGGTVEIGGRCLRSLSATDRAAFRNQTVGFVFQAHNLLPTLTAWENVLLPGTFAPGGADGARALELLQRVGLEAQRHRRPGSLSGGECQRVAIARALLLRPQVVLADEPTGNLDRATGDDILALLQEVQGDGAALVIATHDPAITDRADRVLTLHQGALQ